MSDTRQNRSTISPLCCATKLPVWLGKLPNFCRLAQQTGDCLPVEVWQLPRQLRRAIKWSDKVERFCPWSDMGLIWSSEKLASRRCVVRSFMLCLLCRGISCGIEVSSSWWYCEFKAVLSISCVYCAPWCVCDRHVLCHCQCLHPPDFSLPMHNDVGQWDIIFFHMHNVPAMHQMKRKMTH